MYNDLVEATIRAGLHSINFPWAAECVANAFPITGEYLTYQWLWLFYLAACPAAYARRLLRSVRKAAARDGSDLEMWSDVLHDTVCMGWYTVIAIECRSPWILTTLYGAISTLFWIFTRIVLLALAIALTWWASTCKLVPKAAERILLQALSLVGSTFASRTAKEVLGQSTKTMSTYIFLLRERLSRSSYMAQTSSQNGKDSSGRGLPYIYQPLGDDRSIRLLQVSKRWPFGDAVCEMISLPLRLAQDYEAISYTWGDLPADHDLDCGGCSIRVTKRVFEIVQSRSSFFDKKLLWIDSLCINQDDPDEKVSQILLMTAIFNQATRVMVWLGNAPEALQCLDYVLKVNEKLSSIPGDRDLRRILEIGSADPGWQAFFKMLDHPYWRRAWIIQEITVAKKVVVVYGGHLVGWDVFESFFAELISRNGAIGFAASEATVVPKTMTPVGACEISTLTALRHQYQRGVSYTLGEALVLSTFSKTRIPHDKIYAVLALTPAIHEPSLRPDYRKSMDALLTDVARYCIETDTLFTLARAGIGVGQGSHSTPSWAPDYAHSFLVEPFSGRGCPDDVAYRASGTTELCCTLHPSLPVLSTEFMLFDTIASAGPTFPVPEVGQEDLKDDAFGFASKLRASLVAAYYFAKEKLNPELHANSRQSRDEMFWRTLVGDRVVFGEVGRPAPSSYREYFTAFAMFCGMLPETLDDEDPSEFFIRLGKALNPESKSAFVSKSDKFVRAMLWVYGRRIAVTTKGALCLVPGGSQEGDVISVMKGVPACSIVRRETMPNVALVDKLQGGEQVRGVEWRFVGECYVHGFMDGEALGSGGRWETLNIW